VRLDVLQELLPVDALDVLDGPQDGAAEGAVLEGGRMQVVKDQL
jgi:hypothetical protein